MIAFASAVTKPDVYRRCAEPGIRRAAEQDSELFVLDSAVSIFGAYNELLERATAREDLEALVLVHQDTEIVSSDLCAKARAALADPSVGVAGCVGAIGVRSIAWWEGSVTLASFSNRFEGGHLPSFSWVWEDAPAYAQTGEVETLDGFLLIVSPWAVHNVRFDESLGSSFHGYDLDYCLQVREAGRKVVTIDVRAIHHRPLEMLPDPESWIEAHIAVAEKWSGRAPGIGFAPGTWRERALRADAERAAAVALAYSTALEVEARKRELERALAETTGSVSWRLTAPLRRGRKRNLGRTS